MIRVRESFLRWRLRLSGGRPIRYNLLGRPFVCFPGHTDSEFPFIYGADDSFEIRLLGRWLRAGDGFLDCGANIGVYTAAASAATGPSGRCISVEPGGAAGRMLAEAVRVLNLRNVRIVDAAVGGAVGRTQFHIARDGIGTTSQSIVCDDADREDYEKVTVPMETIDSLVAALGVRVAAIKVDIEGMEADALAAAIDTLASHPLWIIEVHPQTLERFGRRREDVISHFSGGGYEIWVNPKFGGTGKSPRRLSAAETWADAPFHNLIVFPRSGPFAARTLELVENGEIASG